MRWDHRTRMDSVDFFHVIEWRPLPHRGAGSDGWAELGAATFEARPFSAAPFVRAPRCVCFRLCASGAPRAFVLMTIAAVLLATAAPAGPPLHGQRRPRHPNLAR